MDSGVPAEGQWRYMLDHIKHDSEMLTGVYAKPQGKARLVKKWETMAILLNQMEGATKSGEKWKEAWNGLKSRARIRYRSLSAGQPVPFHAVPLSPIYVLVLELVGAGPCMPNPGVEAPQPVAQADEALPEAAQAQAAVPQPEAAQALLPAVLQPAALPQAAAAPQPAAMAQAGEAMQPEAAEGLWVGHAALVGDQEWLDLQVVEEDSLDIFPFHNLSMSDEPKVKVEDVKPDPAVEPRCMEGETWLKEDKAWLKEDEVQEIPVITLSDTPELCLGARRKLLHTPPSGRSGLTPLPKKRDQSHFAPGGEDGSAAGSNFVRALKDCTRALERLQEVVGQLNL